MPLGALTCVFDARRWARIRARSLVFRTGLLALLHSVIFRSALVRIIAAVQPLLTLKSLAHAKSLGLFVEPGPLESKRLTLASAESESHDESDAITPLECCQQQLLDLLSIERLDLFFLNLRSLRDGYGVAAEVTATKGFAERGPCRAVSLMGGCRLQTGRIIFAYSFSKCSGSILCSLCAPSPGIRCR